MARFKRTATGINQAYDHILSERRDQLFLKQELIDQAAQLTGYKNTTKCITVIETRLMNGVDQVNTSGLISYKERIENQNIEQVQRRLSETIQTLDAEISTSEQLRSQVDNLRKNLEESSNVCRIERVEDDGTVTVIEGLYHSQFERVLKLAQAGMNIFLYGPTGSGKSHICEQVAEALDREFASVSCTAGMSEGVLSGRLLPVGESGKFEYIESDFIRCYENGGVFLLDEMDAADPNVLLFINSALANGRVSIPNRQDNPVAKRHKDFVCMAAANTIGTGADRQYSGRNKLDASTMDRFLIGKVLMSYDNRVEEQLCPNDELRSLLQTYRQRIADNMLERAMSTRFIKDAYKMVSEFDWNIEDVQEAFFKGWRKDEIAKVK